MDAEHLGGGGTVVPALLEHGLRGAGARPARGIARRANRRRPRRRWICCRVQSASRSPELAGDGRGSSTPGGRRREMLGPEGPAAGDDRRVLDRVAQLADVARPGAGAEFVEQLRGEPGVGGIGEAGRRRKCSARAGMSSRRSRSGGTWIGKTLRRKYRSSRNWPAAMSSPSGRFVAASTRMSVGRGRESPTGVNDAVLDDPEQLHLEIGRDVAHLVEQHRPAAGQVEQPLPVLVRAGERPLADGRRARARPASGSMRRG